MSAKAGLLGVRSVGVSSVGSATATMLERREEYGGMHADNDKIVDERLCSISH